MHCLLKDTRLVFDNSVAVDLFCQQTTSFHLNNIRSVVFGADYLRTLRWADSQTAPEPHFERMLTKFAGFARLQYLRIDLVPVYWCDRFVHNSSVNILDLVPLMAVVAKIPQVELLVPRDLVRKVLEKVEEGGFKNVQVAIRQER